MHLPQTSHAGEVVVTQPDLLHGREVSPGNGLDGLDLVSRQEEGRQFCKCDVPDVGEDAPLALPC